MSVLNGISGPVTTFVSCVELGDGRVLNLKFLCNNSLLVLWAPEGNYKPLTTRSILDPR